jgi:flagellar basal body-associated protein FliL
VSPQIVLGIILIVVAVAWCIYVAVFSRKPKAANVSDMHSTIVALIDEAPNARVADHLKAAGKALYDAEGKS